MPKEHAWPGLFFCILYLNDPEQADIWDADAEQFICCTNPNPQCLLPSEKAAQQVLDAENFDDRAVVAQFQLHAIDLTTGKMDYSINRLED
ncbi:hypothetical protein SAMN02799624_05330 [Paenibacillus sp. UNC496MF]|uniref:hypothetical protein n=1 Tax=Paenibacillus sp. UNC496MF TaxID=1502753 RepID=UPI0008E31D43|nr:hypothetical protein [Paenibacillus sp. UNC496MF]SFJ64265.1 hypothetical protein SAMN02799624_05330 [Paenibacillus sp. UNC496MF]